MLLFTAEAYSIMNYFPVRSCITAPGELPASVNIQLKKYSSGVTTRCDTLP